LLSKILVNERGASGFNDRRLAITRGDGIPSEDSTVCRSWLTTHTDTRCDIEGVDVPEHIRDFVTSFTRDADRQLALRLV
jgi:hypothetical protein